MDLAERGITFMKLFPAESVGGIPLLKSLAAPFQDLEFCPTGGMDAEKAAAYLALPNVGCIGGSWMVPGPRFPRVTGANSELAADARKRIEGRVAPTSSMRSAARYSVEFGRANT